MTVTCLAFSGVIAEDGLDTQGLSVGPTAPIAGAWSWGRSELTARVPCRPLSTHSLARSMGSTRPPASAQRSRRDPSPVRHVPRRWPVPGADWRHGRQRVTIGWFGSSPRRHAPGSDLRLPRLVGRQGHAHTARSDTGAGQWDEIWVEAVNTDTVVQRMLTIEFGGTGQPGGSGVRPRWWRRR